MSPTKNVQAKLSARQDGNKWLRLVPRAAASTPAATGGKHRSDESWAPRRHPWRVTDAFVQPSYAISPSLADAGFLR